MRNTKILFVCVALIMANSKGEICKNDAGDEFHGSACYLTSHTFTHPLDSIDTAWPDVGEIKEYHLGV